MGDLLEKLPQSLADFLDFLARFASSPRGVLKAYAAQVPAEARVSGALVGFTLWSALLAAVLFQAGAAVGMADDRSATAEMMSRIAPDQAPLAAALMITALTVAWHALAKLISGTLGWIYADARFEGVLSGSINAGLALGAFYVLATSAVLVVTRVAAVQVGTPPTPLLLTSALLGAAFVYHAVGAVAGAHSISWVRAFVIVASPIVIVAALLLE